MWDFAIIGAGPAGCAAALELARTGARVGLLEKAAFPRDKVCGEFLSPEAVRFLDEMGCGASFRAAQPARIERAMVVTPAGRSLEFPLPAPAYGLSRLRFDHLLAQAARAAGAQLVERAEIARAGAALEARDGRKFQARVVLLAAGRHSLLEPRGRWSRESSGVESSGLASSGLEYFGFKAHYDGPCDGRVELYFFRGGYCGLAPVEGGQVNLCCLVERKLLAGRSAEDLLEGVPSLRERLAGMRRRHPFLYTGPVVMGWRRPSLGLLPAGDAALFVDPFTGDGMSLALQTGRMAAMHALRDTGAGACDSARYLAELRRRFGRQLRAGRWLRAAASRPWLERPLMALLRGQQRRRAVFHAAFHATRTLSNLSGLAADGADGRQ